jgi:Type IV secretory system Conjugative DNA transfer
VALGCVFAVWAYGVLHPESHPFTTLTRDGLLAAALVVGYRFLVSRASGKPASDVPVPATVAAGVDPLESVREHAAEAGGGAYLGVNRGSWVFADPEHGVLLLDPPRSGKTSGVVIPALLAAPGACVSTSTKLDVLHATLQARQRSGEVWLFDPTGEHAKNDVEGVRRLSWSPVAAAESWDQPSTNGPSRPGFLRVPDTSSPPCRDRGPRRSKWLVGARNYADKPASTTGEKPSKHGPLNKAAATISA